MRRSISQLISEGADVLRQSGVPEPRLDAGTLLGHVLGRDRAFIISHSDALVPEKDTEEYRHRIGRRAMGEPVQYITGHQEFFGLDFEVSEAVLIPRPETELLVETAIDLLTKNEGPSFVCDVGTGSGCIAISIIYNVQTAFAQATDISQAALDTAKRNASKHGIDRIEFLISNCFDAIDKELQFDLIVSNPPYVAEESLDGLQREVRDYEPRVALTPGGDGLAVIRRLISDAPLVLKRDGHLLLEIGFDQNARVIELVDENVWKILDVYKDLQGIPRTVVLKKL